MKIVTNPTTRKFLLLAIILSYPVDGRSEPTAVIRGRVRYNGSPPERPLLQLVEKDGKVSDCSTLHENGLQSESLLISRDRAVANVFVYVRKGLPRKRYPTPSEPAVLNQDGCMFRPRVQGVFTKQELILKNSDPVLHNVRTLSFRNRPFNVGQPAGSPGRSKSFRRKEKAIMIQCDLHPWMQAHIFVMDHPWFTVTGEAGRFELPALPVGNYTLTAWHEQLGEEDLSVAVTSADFIDVELTFQPNQQDRVHQGKLASTTPQTNKRTSRQSPAAARSFVNKWAIEDFAEAADDLSERSAEKGRTVFHSAGCVKCHLMAGRGTGFGPELTDIVKRFQGAKLLQQILQPSTVINKDFRTQLFITTEGRAVSGLVIKESTDQIHVLPNPLQPEEIQVLKPEDIEKRKFSDVSVMPESLLDSYQRDEILDLLKFLESGGTEKNP